MRQKKLGSGSLLVKSLLTFDRGATCCLGHLFKSIYWTYWPIFYGRKQQPVNLALFMSVLAKCFTKRSCKT